ncbi:MAG: hypothetical protein COU51_02045 [Parcubacteria group bacterium CG10_big_fil_rev_8_21_14_0_10_36_14]|nr:MAG: hypothetical protein COU51_02045 [Parcubacteria group bacterium CG10_big_fil_rev_8_21_14_0_10_36_14]
MPRPRKNRKIRFDPTATYFKPRGIPMTSLEEIILDLDEIEAIHLKDKQGLDQTEAAKKMNISQSTFQRIITLAHKKISEAIIDGKAIKIKTKNPR